MTAPATDEKHTRRGGLSSRLVALANRDRRVTATSAMLAALVVTAALTQHFSGGDHKLRTYPPPPAGLSASFALSRLGLHGRQPNDWLRTDSAKRLELRSADGTMLLVFSSPTSGSFAQRVQRDSERALRDAYRPARIIARLPGRLGRVPASTTEILASQHGHKIRILSIVAASRWRTYAVALFSALPPPDNRLAEAQQILRSITLTAPA